MAVKYHPEFSQASLLLDPKDLFPVGSVNVT